MKNPKTIREAQYTEGINRCDSIFDAEDDQPYLDSTVGGKWGKGKDDMPEGLNEYTPYNNPLPY